MNKKIGNSLIIMIVITAFILIGIGVFMFISKRTTTPEGSTAASTERKGGQLSETKNKGDINRDGVADVEDASLIKKASPCNHVDACWNKVVGKTKDGDNPIYTSDLDLNKDDNVNEMDVSAMSVE